MMLVTAMKVLEEIDGQQITEQSKKSKGRQEKSVK